MTVTTNLNFKEYQANGVATNYTIPFLLLNEADLMVYVDNIVIPKNNYKINGIGNPQSEIVFYSAPKGKLVLQRAITLLRDTDYQENGDLLAATLNKDFDRLYLILQGFRQDDSQNLKVSDPSGINSLPAADQRANKILAFDESGQPKLITSESGSATELAQSLMNDTDPTKGAGQVAYNPSLDYPNHTIGSQLAELKDNLLPLFTTFWWPNRDSIPVGFVAADGQELPILTYLDAANAIANGIVPTVSESDWINDLTKRGCYVANSRNGFFRMPDYNGSYADSLGSLFLRGGNRTLSDGTIQKDAVGDAQVPVSITDNGNALGSQYWDSKTRLAAAFHQAKDGHNNIELNWNIKSVTNTVNMGATDTRPLNVTGCWIVRLFGAVTEIGKADAQQLATDYANMAARISILEGYRNHKKFTIIYPNGGTKENPAIVAVNSRYVMSNPFPNEPVMCEAELLVNGIWGSVGWFFSNGGYGTLAGHILEIDKIVVQTGSAAVGHGSNGAGGSVGFVGGAIPPSPCRVKVWRIV